MMPGATTTVLVLAGLLALGASAGVAAALPDDGDLAMGELVAALAIASFLGAVVGVQLYRHGRAGATLVGGMAGALSLFGFFGGPFLALVAMDILTPPGLRARILLLLVAPVVAGSIAAAGTIILSQGVRRYRARHGTLRAPR